MHVLLLLEVVDAVVVEVEVALFLVSTEWEPLEQPLSINRKRERSRLLSNKVIRKV